MEGGNQAEQDGGEQRGAGGEREDRKIHGDQLRPLDVLGV
jgi:hypothetical protein